MKNVIWQRRAKFTLESLNKISTETKCGNRGDGRVRSEGEVEEEEKEEEAVDASASVGPVTWNSVLGDLEFVPSFILDGVFSFIVDGGLLFELLVGR